MIGTALKALRQSKGYTVSQVCYLIGMNQNTYSKYERDERDVSTETLSKLADFYHVTTDYLLGRETEKADPLEELAFQYDMSILEKKMVEAYLGLKKPTREEIRQALRKAAEEAADEADEHDRAAAPDDPPPAAPKTAGDDIAAELSRLLGKTRTINSAASPPRDG